MFAYAHDCLCYQFVEGHYTHIAIGLCYVALWCCMVAYGFLMGHARWLIYRLLYTAFLPCMLIGGCAHLFICPCFHMHMFGKHTIPHSHTSMYSVHVMWSWMHVHPCTYFSFHALLKYQKLCPTIVSCCWLQLHGSLPTCAYAHVQKVHIFISCTALMYINEPTWLPSFVVH